MALFSNQISAPIFYSRLVQSKHLIGAPMTILAINRRMVPGFGATMDTVDIFLGFPLARRVAI